MIVKDSKVNSFSGKFIDWRLNLWGESIDGSTQSLHPLPEEGDHDHDMDASPNIATTTVEPDPSEPTDPPAEPSDHMNRPVKPKPTKPSPTVDEVDAEAATAAASGTAKATSTSDNFLPSPFPTFGVSKRTQIWIYAASSLIIVFFLALGVYFHTQRRKRIRTTAHDDYEFEMIADDEDDEPGHDGEVGGKKRQRRGGELYDAFARDSDDGLFSEEEDGEYQDHSDNEWTEKSRRRSSDGSHGGG